MPGDGGATKEFAGDVIVVSLTSVRLDPSLRLHRLCHLQVNSIQRRSSTSDFASTISIGFTDCLRRLSEYLPVDIRRNDGSSIDVVVETITRQK